MTIQSAQPFELVYKLMSTSFQLIESVIYEQPFVLVTEVQCTSPWKLSIVSSQLKQVNEQFGLNTAVRILVHWRVKSTYIVVQRTYNYSRPSNAMLLILSIVQPIFLVLFIGRE